MKIVRLNTDQLRAYRRNQSHLVDAEGHLIGRLSPELDTAVTAVATRARQRRQNLDETITAGKPPKTFRVRVAVKRVGNDMNDLAVGTTLDGNRVVSGRDVFFAQMLQEHGECQLRLMNGVILKTLRDPNIRRPTHAESQQLSPKPEHCPCKTWGAPHPGTHHQTCQWNRVAPPEERAPAGEALSDSELAVLPVEALASLAAPRAPHSPLLEPVHARLSSSPVTPPSETEQPDPPERCRNGCLEWVTGNGKPVPAGEHHPMCTQARAWAIQTDKSEPRWLIDLRNGEKVRRATDEEIGRGDVEAKRSGSPIIHLDDVPYAVVRDGELRAQAQEEGAALPEIGSVPPLPAPPLPAPPPREPAVPEIGA